MIVESEVHPEVAKSPLIKIVPISPAPGFLQTNNRRLILLFAPLKAIWQAWALYRAMGYQSKPSEWILLQVCPRIID
jgi:beta-1,4-mannosyltransferase